MCVYVCMRKRKRSREKTRNGSDRVLKHMCATWNLLEKKTNARDPDPEKNAEVKAQFFLQEFQIVREFEIKNIKLKLQSSKQLNENALFTSFDDCSFNFGIRPAISLVVRFAEKMVKAK